MSLSYSSPRFHRGGFALAVLGIAGLAFLLSCVNAEQILCSEPEPCYTSSNDTRQFCNFENGESGFCQSCDDIFHPADCFDHGVPLNGPGGEVCAETCVHYGDLLECSVTDNNETCSSGYSFCDFRFGEMGYCKACPFPTVDECFKMNLNEMSLDACISSCKVICEVGIYTEVFTEDGNSFWGVGLRGSPAMDVSGPLVDCSQLILEDVDTPCADNAENAICLVGMSHHPKRYFYETIWRAEKNGCAAVLVFVDSADLPSNSYRIEHLWGQKTSIPSLTTSAQDGKHLLDEKLGTRIELSNLVEDECNEGCSESFPCSSSDWYCDYELGDDGFCSSCETDGACFFRGMSEQGVQECTKVCGESPTLTFPDCKFCPNEVSGSDHGSADEDATCAFCPEDDMKYPRREMELFGPGISCWLVNEFFLSRDIHKSDQNCQLAQMFNYQCGCTGPGYAGANTSTKRTVLIWLPRTMAILSALGSSFIFFDVLRARKRRKRVTYQMMLVLSIFDVFGSIAYAFTSLPIPATEYIEGSQGNEASCMAQGFFIQIGATACYMNVSLAFYYLLVIKMGWHEHRIKKARAWLFACPIVIGLSFAFAGIPFYDNMILWCNNTAKWWPDIPVAVAIAIATVIMFVVCWDVYKKEKKSLRWNMSRQGFSTCTSKTRQGSSAARKDFSAASSTMMQVSSSNRSNHSFTSKVTWQTFWYLMAFYVTWLPYLALQYAWASGRAFTMYGFILFAGTAVPLQGFWNFIVYIRPRYLSKIGCVPSCMCHKPTRLDSGVSDSANPGLSPSKDSRKNEAKIEDETNGVDGVITLASGIDSFHQVQEAGVMKNAEIEEGMDDTGYTSTCFLSSETSLQMDAKIDHNDPDTEEDTTTEEAQVVGGAESEQSTENTGGAGTRLTSAGSPHQMDAMVEDIFKENEGGAVEEAQVLQGTKIEKGTDVDCPSSPFSSSESLHQMNDAKIKDNFTKNEAGNVAEA